MLCTTCFQCLSTDFVGSTNTINICLILSTIYSFIPVIDCVGRAPMHYFAQGPMKLYDPVSEYSDLFVWMSLIEIYKYLQWLFYLYIVPHQVMWVTFSTWFQWSPIPIIRQSFSHNISLWKSVIFTNNQTFSSIFTCKNLSCPWIIFIFNLSGDIVVLNSFKN